MNEWDNLEICDRETWGALVKYLRGHGVSIEETEGRFPYNMVKRIKFLRRETDTGPVSVTLPEGCEPKTLCRFRACAYVCRRLKLPEPKNWPIAF